MPMATATFEPRICILCGKLAHSEITAPAIITGNSTPHKTSIDVAIGKKANEKWENINRRQGIRDKVRRETGKIGLSMTGRDEFKPVSDENKVARTKANTALQEKGTNPQYSKADAKLVK